MPTGHRHDPVGSPAARRVHHRCGQTAVRSTVRGPSSARSASSLELVDLCRGTRRTPAGS